MDLNQTALNEALVDAAEEGNLSRVAQLIDQGAKVSVNEDLAFRSACVEGHLAVAEFLLMKGANIHACSDRALRLCVINSDLDMVKFLVEKGADIEANDFEAISHAAQQNSMIILPYLLASIKEHDDYRNILHRVLADISINHGYWSDPLEESVTHAVVAILDQIGDTGSIKKNLLSPKIQELITSLDIASTLTKRIYRKATKPDSRYTLDLDI